MKYSLRTRTTFTVCRVLNRVATAVTKVAQRIHCYETLRAKPCRGCRRTIKRGFTCNTCLDAEE